MASRSGVGPPPSRWAGACSCPSRARLTLGELLSLLTIVGVLSALLLPAFSRARQHARHFGGVNIGFLDGHAQWFDSEQVIAESPSAGDRHRGHLRGYGPWGPTKDAPWYDPNAGIPALY